MSALAERLPHTSTSERKQDSRPSWKEKIEVLNVDQLLTAEIVMGTRLIRAINTSAEQQLPWLVGKSPGGDRTDVRFRYVAGVLDAVDALSKGPDQMRKFQRSALDRPEYLLDQARRVLDSMEGQRDEVFEEAQSWGAKDNVRVLREAHHYLAKIPRDQAIFLEERAGIPQETMKEKVIRKAKTPFKWATSGTTHILSSAAMGSLTFAGGTAMAEANPLERRSFTESLAVLALSYGTWGYGLAHGIKANDHLLDRDDISTNILSKLGHSIDEARGAGKRAFARAGYLTWEAAKEVPWYVYALAVAPQVRGYTSIQSIEVLAGANLVAGAFEGTKALLTHGSIYAQDKFADRRARTARLRINVVETPVANGSSAIVELPKASGS